MFYMEQVILSGHPISFCVEYAIDELQATATFPGPLEFSWIGCRSEAEAYMHYAVAVLVGPAVRQAGICPGTPSRTQRLLTSSSALPFSGLNAFQRSILFSAVFPASFCTQACRY